MCIMEVMPKFVRCKVCKGLIDDFAKQQSYNELECCSLGCIIVDHEIRLEKLENGKK